MAKTTNGLILFGIFTFSIGMFIRGVYQSNTPSFDYFGLVNGLLIVGVISLSLGICANCHRELHFNKKSGMSDINHSQQNKTRSYFRDEPLLDAQQRIPGQNTADIN